jgi:SAM-dependent methyltransferase
VEDEGRRRAQARSLARAALARGEPLAWFEELYLQADGPGSIPWADLRPNPFLLGWLESGHRLGTRALVVGCGLGDDAAELAARGQEVTACDIAPAAIERCRRRFPESRAVFCVADILDPPHEWRASFDFVLSAYTLQVLPAELRPRAAAGIASTLAPGGCALVISRGREESEPAGEMPWPLSRAELLGIFAPHLGLVELADFYDDEQPPVRRLRLTLARAAAADAGCGATAG